MHEKIEIERRESQRITSLEVDGELVGKIKMSYFSKPFPLYYIEDFDIIESRRGRGFGSKLLFSVEKALQSSGKAGVLGDAILESSPAKGIYRRHGWIHVPRTFRLFAFNLPQKESIDKLASSFFIRQSLHLNRVLARQSSKLKETS